MKTGNFHLFFLFLWLITTFEAHAKEGWDSEIRKMHSSVEKMINYSPDSSIIVLNLAKEKIKRLEKPKLEKSLLAENHLRRADYWSSYDIDTSFFYLDKASNYYLQNVDHKKLAEIYILKGQLIKIKGNYQQCTLYEALPNFDTALVHAIKHNSPDLLSFVYYEKAFTLQLSALWQQSFENAIQSLHFAILSKDSLNMATSYFLMGRIYHHFGLFNSSESYISKSIDYGSGMFKIYAIIHIYADVLLQNGKVELAMKNYQRTLDICLEKEDFKKAITIHTNIGQSKFRRGDFKGAEENYFSMKKLTEMENYESSFTQLFSAQMQHYWKNEDLAKERLAEFKKLSLHFVARPHTVDMYKEAADLFAAMGNTDESAFYYKKWGLLKDSIYTNTSRLQLSDLEKMFLTERRKNGEISLKNSELSSSRNRQATLGILLILLSSVGGGLIYFIRMRGLKENQALKFALKEKQIEQFMKAQETERQRLARELHDGVGQSLAALKMQLQFDENPKANNTALKRVDAICKEVRSLSHQMMPMVLKENGIQSAIEQLVELSFSATPIEIDFVSTGLQNRLTDNIEIHTYRITQELISNILKHSKASKVGIQILKRGNVLLLIVEDNGVGLDSGENSQGIGLKNIQARLESLGGEMQIQSEEQGTFIRVTIPLKTDPTL